MAGKKYTSYFDLLRFDKKLLSTFRAKYLSNIRLIILLIVLIIVGGVSSFLSLPKRLNPEVEIPIVSVSTVLPGANPNDVESLLTIPIEDAVDGVEGITKVTSSSNESVSSVVIEFESRIDADSARDDVQSAIDTVDDLPEDASTPRIFTLDFENQPVWTFALTSDDTVSLLRFTQRLQDRLEEESSIDRVSVSGLEDREVRVTLSAEKVAEYGISPLALSSSVRNALASFPAGTTQTSDSTFAISIDPTVSEVSDIGNILLSVGDQIIALGDIAAVSETPEENQSLSYFANESISGDRVVVLSVYKTSSSTITDAADDAEQVVDHEMQAFGDTFSIIDITNNAKEINDQFNDLLRNFATTISLVFLSLLLFLGIRQAAIASFSIPLTFLISFMVMQFTGISINFLSLFSLLLSLGILVDVTIVVISAVTSYHRTGKFSPLESGLLVWKDFIVPITTTTLTTVWAFLPLLLSTGIIGEFIKSIPIVVSSTLIAAAFVATFIALPLMIAILSGKVAWRVKVLMGVLFVILVVGALAGVFATSPFFVGILLLTLLFLFALFKVRKQIVLRVKKFFRKHKKASGYEEIFVDKVSHGLFSFESLSSSYSRTIRTIVESRNNRIKTVIAVVIFSIFSYLLVPFGFVVNEFFPKTPFDILYVNVEYPEGKNLSYTTLESLRLLDGLRETPGVEYVTLEVGQAIDPGSGSSSSSDNLAQFTLVLPAEEMRDTDSIEIAERLRKTLKAYTRGDVSVVEISGGPPAGADVQINLLGEELSVLDNYADSLVSYLRDQEGVTNVSKSVSPGVSKLRFEPDQAKLLENGLTLDSLGLWLRTYHSGFTLDDIKVDGETYDIVFRVDSGTSSPSDLGRLAVPTPQGTVPLLSLGDVRLAASPTQITREDGSRTIRVTAATIEGYSSPQISADLVQHAETLDFAPGYQWSTGGVNEENERSVASILQAMLLSFFLILATVVVQLGSYRKAVLVMLVIPLAVSGVFVIFALTGTPLSFPALIGVLALFGIVINNSIIMVEKINQNIAIGMKFVDSVVDGATTRLEPIFLSSLTTVIGLLPITLSDPLWQGLGGAIIAGLLFSGTIMLFFIPVMYYLLFAKGYSDRF